MSKLCFFLASVLISAVFGVACGENVGNGTPQLDAGQLDADQSDAATLDDDAVSTGQCTRDEELLAESRNCRVDNHCPCGAFCDLGRCIFECTSDSDCADGQLCTDVGRCAAPGGVDSATVAEARGTLEVRPRVLPSIGPGQSLPVDLHATRAAVKRVRLVASPGLQLLCSASANPTSECIFETEIPAGEKLSVEVQAVDATQEPRFLAIHTIGKVQTVSMKPAPQSSINSLVDGDPTGLFEGYIELVEEGIDGEPLQPVATNQVMPLQAEVHLATGGVLMLVDPLKRIHPEGRWIGDLVLSGDPNTLDLPSFIAHQGALEPGAETEVMISAEVSGLEFHDLGSSLHFDLTRRAHGILVDDRALVAKYRVVLDRSDRLPSGAVAPQVPTSATVSVDDDQIYTYTPWEKRVDDTILGTVPPLSSAQRNAFVDAFSGQGNGSLRFCAGDPASRLQDTADRWMGRWFDEQSSPNRRLSQWAAMPGEMYQELANFMSSALTLSLSTLQTSSSKLIGIAPDLGWQWPWSDVPCQFEMGAASYDLQKSNPNEYYCIPMVDPQGNPDSYPFAARQIDQCAGVAADLGCEVTDDLVTDTFTTLAQTALRAEGYCETEGTLSSTLQIQKVCRMNLAPPICPEIILCDASGVQTGTSGRTGEYACNKQGYGVAIGADIRADSGETIKSDELFDSCISDLDRLFDGVDAASDLDTLLAPGACLNPSRFLYALGAAAKGTRESIPGFPDQRFAASSRSQKHTHRLMQRWLQLHGFLAREASQRDQLEHILRDQSSTAPTPAQTLTISMRGWELFFHPRFATALNSLSNEVLLRPDWRPELDPQVVTSSDHQHDVGISVAMIETLGRQFTLAGVHLEQAAYRFDESAIDDVTPLLRISEIIRAQAVGLHARAAAAAQDEGLAGVPWGARFHSEMTQLDIAYNRLLNLIDDLRNGEPPLPIADSDLPLYFFGDAAGPGERFAAISDFLLGRVGTSDIGWAEKAITSADASFTTVRDRWTALREREWRAELSSAVQDQRVDNLRQRYGDQINELCFLPLDAYDVLDLPKLSPNTCFIDEQAPECAIDVAAFARGFTADDLALQLCAVHRLAEIGQILTFDDPDLTGIAYRYEDCVSISYDPSCNDFGEAGCLECVIDNETILRAPVSPKSIRVRSDVARNNRAHSRVLETCQEAHPRARRTTPPTRQLDQPGCLRGSMGESMLTILSTAKDVEIAKAEYDEYMDAYDITMRSCARLQTANDKIRSSISGHNRTMEKLRAGKLASDTTALVAGGVKDCTNSLASAAGDAALSFGSAVGFGTLACVAGGFETAANVASAGIELEMDNTQASHEAVVDGFERSADVDRCKIEAEMELVGLRAAGMRITKAIDELNLTRYQLDEQKNLVAALFAEGKNSLARVEGRAVSPPGGQLWLDEEVDIFSRRMRLARRTAYLTVRAVEYEFQQSLTARYDVLSALRPSELMAVVNDLRTQAATRGINGSRPSDLKVVLSLRDHLMQLHDRTDAPVGETQLTEIERFRERLKSDQYKAFDEQGQFIGVRIPFELSPLEALGLADSGGIGIFAQTDCAERLWSANASVVGSQDVLRGGSTFTRMDLLKRNTFYSQRCGVVADGENPFQVASVRPSNNLFRDPQYGGEVAESRLGLVNGTELFSRARMQPAVNVTREDFEDDAYANGQTSELAARGLYGDYALLIPSNMLSGVDDQGNAVTDGLDLSKVDDILIRLDYVSVAR